MPLFEWLDLFKIAVLSCFIFLIKSSKTASFEVFFVEKTNSF